MTVNAAEALTKRPPKVDHCDTCGSPMIWTPVLRCAHCGKDMPLRAYSYEIGPGRFVAECIDLDLLSQGNTKEEAIGRLQEAMFGYLEAAFNGKSVRGLVLRPSPISHRLRYHFHMLKRSALGLFNKRKHGRHFLAPSRSTTERLCHG